MISANTLCFTVLTDAVSNWSAKPTFYESVAELYGQGHDAKHSILISESDLKDDLEARRILGAHCSGLETSDISNPLVVPPLTLRRAVSMVMWLLVRRWGRGRWPFALFNNRGPRSLRTLSRELDIDAGQLSRVMSGNGTLSLPSLTRVLRFAGYRLAVGRLGGSRLLGEAIRGGTWRSAADQNGSLLEREGPPPTLLPVGGSSYDYGKRESFYLIELNEIAEKAKASSDNRPLQIVSRSHFYRVRRGQSYFSIDMLVTIAEEFDLEFMFLPMPMGIPNGIGMGGQPKVAYQGPRELIDFRETI